MGTVLAPNFNRLQFFDTEVRFEEVSQLGLRGKIENSTERRFPIFSRAAEMRIFLAEAKGQVASTRFKLPVHILYIFLPLLRKDVMQELPIIGEVETVFHLFQVTKSVSYNKRARQPFLPGIFLGDPYGRRGDVNP